MSEHTFLEIDTDGEIEKIIRQVNDLRDKISSPAILQRAVKTTAQKVRTQLVKDTKERYALTDERGLKDPTKGAPRITSSTGASVSSTIHSKGPMQDIMAFLTQPNTKTGAAAAQVLNGGTPKQLVMDDLKAFVTRFSNGHTAIVQRRGANRLPIKKLLSPAVPHLMGNEEVRTKAETLAVQILQKEIEKQIKKANAARA